MTTETETRRLIQIWFSSARFEEVRIGKRTVTHLPISAGDSLGEETNIFLREEGWRWERGEGSVTVALTAKLVSASKVRLLAVVDADLVGLGLGDDPDGRGAYLARWDALHSTLPSASDPEVWRIEWAPPVSAFSLAT